MQIDNQTKNNEAVQNGNKKKEDGEEEEKEEEANQSPKSPFGNCTMVEKMVVGFHQGALITQEARDPLVVPGFARVFPLMWECVSRCKQTTKPLPSHLSGVIHIVLL
jgi:hypothetical protein